MPCIFRQEYQNTAVLLLTDALAQRFREDRVLIRNEAFQCKGQAVAVPRDKDTARYPVADGQVELC